MKPGDLVIIKLAPDQPPWVSKLAGKPCIVIRNLTEADGVFSSKNMWEVLLDGRVLEVHKLDVEPP